MAVVREPAQFSTRHAVTMAMWHVAALVVVMLGPLIWRAGEAVDPFAPAVLPQAAAAGFGYVLAALLAGQWPVPSSLARGAATLAVTGVIFAAIAALFIWHPELALSRGLLLVGAALSAGLLLIPVLLPRLQRVLVVPLAIVAVVALIPRPAPDAAVTRIESEYYSLLVGESRSPWLAEHLDVEGGGLARAGDQMLLVTGSGRFARLRPQHDRTIGIDELDVPSPANVDEFRADAPAGVMVQWFRVMDIAVQPAGEAVRVSVSHHYWNRAAKCFELRVSTATVSPDLQSWSRWETLFDAQPCLQIKAAERSLPFYGSESGGRLLSAPDGLYLTVGDHAFDGFNADEALAQVASSHYGKTVRIAPDGSASVFTSGHRNPQGLARDDSGRFWETEHGPRGGDELNLLRPGGNYGWPWRTHGTEYAMRRWPPLKPADAAFTEPALAFVPSRGISSLIAPTGDTFANWRGDLLVATLKSQQLMRVRLDGERPVYVEEIGVGHEVRDLEQAADGTLVAWTDDGAVLAIAPDADDIAGDAQIARCTGCHTLNQGQFGALGPNLYGIIGRPVASSPGFSYSEGLKNVGGRWTPERLDQFLTSPRTFAPGSMMGMAVPDANARRLMIEFLRTADARR